MVDAGDDRVERRHVEVVVGVDVGLIGEAERVGAVRTCSQHRLEYPLGAVGQRATC